MKKSKILVPALGVLILSTAAAVSGTVAWFAATRSATVGVTNNTIINPEGALKCDITAGHITTVSEDKKSVAITEGRKLRDASVNVASLTAADADPSVYRAHVDELGAVTRFELLDDYADAYNETDGVYYCATFTLTFTLEGSSTALFDVFFDPGKSTYNSKSLPTGSQEAVLNSYRLAMYSDVKAVVWAPNAENKATVAYTNGTTPTSLGTVNCNHTTTVTSASYANHDAAVNNLGYLGQLCGHDATGDDLPTELKVSCVIWFDGNDPECLSSNLAAGVEAVAEAAISFNALEASEYTGS